MNVIDLFAGAGGFSKGFKEAGFNILAANEIDYEIAQTYIHNHSKTKMIIGDISEKKEELKLFQNISVVIGGPPCQGFSLAGARNRRVKHTKFLDDKRNYLFREYIEIVKAIKPEVFVIENVPGLVNIKNGKLLDEIIDILRDKTILDFEYNVQWTIINASEFGVPQVRKRTFIVGINKKVFNGDFFNLLYKNEKEPVKNLRDSIFDLRDIKNTGSLFPNHIPTNHSKKAIDRMKKIDSGENYKKLMDPSIKSVHSGSYGRMSWDKPAKTITTRFDTPSGGEYIHPDYNRTITAREAARIQTFHDDFIFLGSKSSIQKQIGNAVPPLLSYKIAKTIRSIMIGEMNHEIQ